MRRKSSRTTSSSPFSQYDGKKLETLNKLFSFRLSSRGDTLEIGFRGSHPKDLPSKVEELLSRMEFPYKRKVENRSKSGGAKSKSRNKSRNRSGRGRKTGIKKNGNNKNRGEDGGETLLVVELPNHYLGEGELFELLDGLYSLLVYLGLTSSESSGGEEVG